MFDPNNPFDTPKTAADEMRLRIQTLDNKIGLAVEKSNKLYAEAEAAEADALRQTAIRDGYAEILAQIEPRHRVSADCSVVPPIPGSRTPLPNPVDLPPPPGQAPPFPNPVDRA